MIKRGLWLMTFVLAIVVASPEALAAFRKPRVLLAGAENTAAYLNDVQAKLNGLGWFAAVDIFNTAAGTPSAATLRQYDAVMVWSRDSFSDATTLGSNLADYVDAGGGVVVATFANSETNAAMQLGGRWATGGYNLITPGGGFLSSGPQSMAAISAANDADLLVNGVQTLNGGMFSFRPNTTSLLPGAFVVANWTDGKLLAVASTTLPGRVDLGMFPVSNTVFPDSWVAAHDGARLMGNALLRTIRPRVLLVAADGSGAFPPDVVAKLRSTGKIGIVDTFAAQTATPTLATLLTYDAALVYSNLPFSDPGALGDVLADYTDRGGGVVVGMFATGAPGASGFPAGRFALQGYALTSPTGGRTTGSAATLGAVAYPDHPIMAGVASFNGGTSSPRPTSTAVPGHATVIANWSDGKLLAVTSTRFPNRADLGFFPPSNTVSGGLWDAATDGAKLLANTVEYVVKPYVMYLHSDGPGSTNTLNVRTRLLGLRRFSAVTTFDAAAGTPTAAQLRPLNAVLLSSDFDYTDAVTLGNRLADYVDAGGGVVVSTFANVADPSFPGAYPQGRWIPDYQVIPTAGNGAAVISTASLGTIFQSGHPIMLGVAKLLALNAFRPPISTLSNATRLANWNDGRTLAAVSTRKRRVDLGLFPPSSTAFSSYWATRQGGATLMGNALQWVVNSTPCLGDIDGNGAVGANDLSNLLACFGLAVTPGPCAAADLDGNGTIGANDLSNLLANFGVTCTR
ncbi:MAG: hypothetical protein IBJ11_05160 [Phycisphaerales bacterium]|nr:hypothetical protein [Phycisphaerales bacterium]